MIWLLLFLLAVLLLGIWGAVKLTLWVLLIALIVVAVVAIAARGAFRRL